MKSLAWHRSGCRAAAGLEFAIIAPIAMIVLMLFYDVTSIVIGRWQITAAADAIARIATTMAATTSGTNTLTDTQARTASTAIFGAMPFLLHSSAASYGVTITSVVTTPAQPGCVSNCRYNANVAWSLVLQGNAVKRPCGTLSSMLDGQPPSNTSLPVDVFTSAPILVIDVSYQYFPVIATVFGDGLRLAEAAYMGTRIGNDSAWVHLTGPLAATAQCPGYTG